MIVWHVEDDAAIAAGVSAHLEAEGFQAEAFPDGLTLRNQMGPHLPDILLLDWNLPGDSGASLCRWARRLSPELPIIMVTVRDDPADIVAGLQAGADDYVTKPFDLDVLTMRIRALLRRTHRSPRLECGVIALDGVAGRAFVRNAPLDLTPQEYQLLQLMLQNKGCLVSRQRLRRAIWEDKDRPISDNAITVAVKRLREKLGDADCIRTVRNLGYRMEEPA